MGDPYAAVAMKQPPPPPPPAPTEGASATGAGGVEPGGWAGGLTGGGTGATTVFRTMAALWPLREMELTTGREDRGESRLSWVSCGPACGKATEATLPVGLTYTYPFSNSLE